MESYFFVSIILGHIVYHLGLNAQLNVNVEQDG